MTPEHDEKVLWEGRHLRLVQKGQWEYVVRRRISGIVGVVAVTEDGRMLLVEQYRPPVHANVIELPAGLAGDVQGSEREGLIDAAMRELLEETGYSAESMTFLTDGPPSSGITNEIISLFLAHGLKRVDAGGGDKHERITVHEVPIAGIEDWLEAQRTQGKLLDLRIYTALHFLHSR